MSNLSQLLTVYTACQHQVPNYKRVVQAVVEKDSQKPELSLNIRGSGTGIGPRSAD